MDKKEMGRLGEEAVCRLLSGKGFKIVSRNFTVRGGEIDIIAESDEIIAFVEVKTRKADSMLNGFESVTRSKQRLIVLTAQKYLLKHPSALQPRFDAALAVFHEGKVINIDYIENAFEAAGFIV